jgi:glycosyltransferase involved in cell wall biosynthesis
MNKDTVSVVCTSFNRPDLLETTLRTFHKYNTYPIEDFIVIDDSGEYGCNEHLGNLYPTIGFRYNPERIGQIRSIDEAYEQIDSRYVFHLEEDWEFYKGGFIEDSLAILKSNPTVQQVWIRAEGDTNGHPHYDSVRTGEDNITEYYIVRKNHNRKWHGFSFNPGLRRMGDYFQHGPYNSIAEFIPDKPWASEMRIGDYMMRRGFVSAIIKGDGYVRHIGDGRGIRN